MLHNFLSPDILILSPQGYSQVEFTSPGLALTSSPGVYFALFSCQSENGD